MFSLCAALLALTATAEARDLKPAGISASSTYPSDANVSYETTNLTDLKASTVWAEGAEGSGLGSWLLVDLGGEKTVTGAKLWNGNWYTSDFWARHSRIKELEVEFSDGSVEKFTLKDEKLPEVVRFSKPKKTTSVKFKVKSVYSGNTYNDTCVSEVQVFDDEPPEYAKPASYKASSIYPEDADGNYFPSNLEDGLVDSMWCEANKAGDGVGEWIEWSFPSATSISKLKMRNGNAFSLQFFMKANSAVSGTLTFADGSTHKVTIKPTMMDQVIEFPAKSTTKVRLTIDEVRKGKEFNDLCISEAVFLP